MAEKRYELNGRRFADKLGIRTTNDMSFREIDVVLRGATAGLFLMIALVLLTRSRPLEAIKLLDATIAFAGIAHSVVTAPFVPLLACAAPC